MEQFENSPEYNKAQEDYKRRIYNNLLTPELIIPDVSWSSFDTLYLFYDDNSIEEIFNLFLLEWENYENDNEEILPILIGCQKPMIERKHIFGKERKYIILWYDSEEETLIEQLNKFNKK